MDKYRQEMLEKFFEAMVGFIRLLGVNKEQLAQQAGANRSQYELLMRLCHAESLTIGQIAEQMHTTSSAATQLVEVLVDQGWAAKMTDPSDGRRVCISLTNKGRQQAAKAKAIMVQRLGERLAALPDAELQQITRNIANVSQVLAATANDK